MKSDLKLSKKHKLNKKFKFEYFQIIFEVHINFLKEKQKK